MYKSRNIKLRTANSFTESFRTFQASNKARNLSDKTIHNYYQDEKMIMVFMGGDFSLSAITGEMIIKYIEFLIKRGNKDVSINTRLRALRTIINHFAERGYMEKIKVTMLKVDKAVKETYTEEELKLLLKKPNLKTCAFDDVRTWAIENFLIGTGARLSTVINIKMADLHLDENEVIFRHMKARQQVIIPIVSSLKMVLTEYLQFRKAQSENDYLFPTWHNKQLTSSALISSVVRYNSKRGVTKHGIHMFRHSFAKLWIRNNGGVFELQRMLTHKSLEMTKEYVQLYSSDMQNTEAYNPLNKLVRTGQHIKL